jgi:hypothetical protein
MTQMVGIGEMYGRGSKVQPEVLGRINRLLPLDTTKTGPAVRTACVFTAAVQFLPNHCLVSIRGYTYKHTCTLTEGLYSVPR